MLVCCANLSKNRFPDFKNHARKFQNKGIFKELQATGHKKKV